MSATTQGNWPALEAIAAAGVIPPDNEGDLERRLEMQLGSERAAGWEPTPLGEALLLSIVTIAVRTATPEHHVRAYAALEDHGALDRIMDDLQASIVREVRQATA